MPVPSSDAAGSSSRRRLRPPPVSPRWPTALGGRLPTVTASWSVFCPPSSPSADAPGTLSVTLTLCVAVSCQSSVKPGSSSHMAVLVAITSRMPPPGHG